MADESQEIHDVTFPEDESQIYVKYIRDVDDGRRLVFDKEGGGWLVYKSYLKDTSAWQPVSRQHLEEPYSFESEIRGRMPTRMDIARTLWRAGLVTKEDLDNPTKRQAFESVFPRIS